MNAAINTLTAAAALPLVRCTAERPICILDRIARQNCEHDDDDGYRWKRCQRVFRPFRPTVGAHVFMACLYVSG